MYSSVSHPSESSRSLHFAWLVWGLAATFYFSDYLARVAPGVMHQSLQQAFGINEAGFGILTASFYILYVMMQIPVGLMVDRLSIRSILTIMALLTALGCTIFGMAHGLMVASMARMLIGFSAAFAFISALRLATAWFPPAMLGLLAGLTQALGMLGAAAGQAPVSYLVAQFGWRTTSFMMSVLFVGLAFLLFSFIKDKPGMTAPKGSASETFSIKESLRITLSHKYTWLNALYAGFLFAPTAVIGEAIGPAYLQYGRGFSAATAAFATGLIFIGWGIGGPVSGWMSDRMGRRKPFMVLSAVMGLILTSLFVFLPKLSPWMAYTIFFAFGLTNTGVAIAYAVSTEIQDRRVLGTVIAFTNMISIFVGACMQPIVGRLVDMVAGSRSFHVAELSMSDFQAGLCLLPICSLVALGLAWLVPETYCKPLTKHSPHTG